ncbi:hypothetical protein MVEN_02430700 [Mycena venus]|uniref:F-box domain-containing protein n=1 Tax=Mycena venus TaxID=2733690 RepID=A0A8H7CBL1_9AGAR|nr:hypothetical protein MVEN_02430700 [Mycena venus]
MESPQDFDLDEDVLLKVLIYCDAYTLLTVSRVNKFFFRITHTKSLWLALCANLVSTYLLDEGQSDDLENCSTAEIIQTVKRLVCGPQSWSDGSPVPKLSRKLSIDIEIPHFGMLVTMVQLLPGGRYIVVHRLCLRLECWNLATRQCVWTRSLPELYAQPFRVQMVDGGKAVLFLLFPVSLNTRVIHIVRVSLATGFSEDLFSMPCPVHADDCRNLVFFGDFFAITLRIRGWVVLLVNWSEERCILFNSNAITSAPASALSAGHFFLADVKFHNTSSIPQLFIYPLKDLPVADWQATSSIGLQSRNFKTTQASPVDILSVTAWHGAPPSLYLTVHESPLRRGCLKITMNISGQAPRPVSEETTFLTRLQHKLRPPTPQFVDTSMLAVFFTSQSPHFRVELARWRTVIPSVFQRNHDLSHGGYNVHPDTGEIRDVDPQRQRDEASWMSSIRSNCESFYISTSGALTMLEDTIVTVEYYV